MARKPAQSKIPDAVIDAALELAAERPWEDVRLSDIAARTGLSLSDLRAAYDGKMDILAGFTRRIDRAVLDSIDPDLSAEPPRERLFDILMTRFDVLMPYRDAVKSIVGSLENRPGDLLGWKPVTVRSMNWMLEAAGIDTGGRLGAVAANGLALAYGRTMRVWLRDDDEGMARTMVELDRRLTEGERWMRRLDGLSSFADAIERIRSSRRRRRRDRRDEPPAAQEDVAGSGI